MIKCYLSHPIRSRSRRRVSLFRVEARGKMNEDSGNEIRRIGTLPSFRSYYQLLLSRRGASGSFRPRCRDKKSNDYRPRYCERASIVATVALGADKRWEEYNPLVSSGSPADDGFQCFLPTFVSPTLARHGIRWETVSSTWRYARNAEIPRDPEDPVFIFPRVPLNGNDRQRGCDNSSRIIALALVTED